MKKSLFFILSLFIVTDVSAGVRMLGGSGGSGATNYAPTVKFENRSSTYKVTNGRQWCIENGYESTSCEGNVGIIVTCPKNSNYVHCCPPKYRFKKEFCESKGYIPSTDNCKGYYRCFAPVPVVPQEQQQQ